MTTCDKCGKEYGIGDWPFCDGGHGKPSPATTAPFVPYFDYGLGKQINSQAERWKHMKAQNAQYSSKGEY